MSIDEEIYYESHEEELLELYQDYLIENGLTEAEFTLADFRREF